MLPYSPSDTTGWRVITNKNQGKLVFSVAGEFVFKSEVFTWFLISSVPFGELQLFSSYCIKMQSTIYSDCIKMKTPFLNSRNISFKVPPSLNNFLINFYCKGHLTPWKI